MRTILGPFQPYLESAFVDEVCACKEANPFAPLLILVPSTALRQHLKLLLSRQQQLSLLNVHLLTFHQLTLRLFAETSGNPVELRDDLFLEAVLRHLVQARAPGAEAFVGIEERAGGCAALWQTLRDLRDGAVDPQFALEALHDTPAAGGGDDRTNQLLQLLHTQVNFCRDRGIRQQSDLDKLATQQAPALSYLEEFDRIFYYGFYDLTQMQLDFFRAVAGRYPVTLFFPLLPGRPAHDAWAFAERFYERHVQGYNTAPTRQLIDASQTLPRTFKLFDAGDGRHYHAPSEFWRCSIVNSFGMHDEIAAAAKEILRLVEEERMEFYEIGVVARTLDGYRAAIKEIFHEHQIPLHGEMEEPLVQFPLIKAVILLLNLPSKDFFRPQVIDLLSSPYFRSTGFGEAASRPRPELWDLATRELAICKGISEWRRLRSYANRDIVVSRFTHDDESRFIRVPAAQIRRLAEIVETLAADLLNLPEQASWTEYAQAWKRLLEKYLGVSLGHEPAANVLESLNEKVLFLLDQIADLDTANDRVSLNEFSQTLQRWLERSALGTRFQTVDGIRVLDATAARGLSFRALFILGLNEGVFPRTIREDAFLRDRDREILERDLGYKVNPKLSAFDEEKLLFTLLVNAASENLYCSFQRSDDSGRVLAPSWYLSELKRALTGASARHLTEITIPRSTRDRSKTPPFDRDDLLLPEELAIRLSLEGQDPGALIAQYIAVPEVYEHGRAAVAELDRSAAKLCGFDGAVGALPGYWHNFSKRVSPTALESYARCPFQFFVHNVLSLERLDQPETLSGLGASEYGKLGHDILKGIYLELIERGYFNGTAASMDVDRTMAAVAQQVCAGYEKKNPVGYPLTWQCLKEDLAELIRRVVTRDLQEMAMSGFTPVALETDVEDPLSEDWPEPVKGITIRGRMDRIDRHPDQNRLRVIDYKFKFSGQPAAQDKNLERAALRGEKLQPPLYTLLGERWARATARPTPQVEAVFYYIAPRWRDGPLARAEFAKDGLAGRMGAELKKTIAALADGIREGRFYIQRGAYCEHCDIAEICRKNHPPSLWRAENDPVTRVHREIREKDPAKL